MAKQMEFEFYTRYNPPPSPGVKFVMASRTRQEFAQESDLNNIMAKYAAGLAPIPTGNRMPMYGDFSEIPDYATALQRVIKADELFMQLPAKLRRRFDDDPQALLDFLQDENNRDEAIKLGLISPDPRSMPQAQDAPSEKTPPAEKAAEGKEQA